MGGAGACSAFDASPKVPTESGTSESSMGSTTGGSRASPAYL